MAGGSTGLYDSAPEASFGPYLALGVAVWWPGLSARSGCLQSRGSKAFQQPRQGAQPELPNTLNQGIALQFYRGVLVMNLR